jgi:hypothetical protein
MIKNILLISVFFILSVFTAYICHKKVNNYFIACIIAGIISSAIYQLLGIIILGYCDPFLLMAFGVGAGIAFLIAVIAGIPIRYFVGKTESGRAK